MNFDSKASNEKWKEAEMGDTEVKTPVADFASKMMRRSLVTGVANIAETSSKPKKFFKVMVLLLCTCGFFYQAVAFMQHILTFPSVVNIEVYIPHIYTHPAYTFCNNNGIKRTKFCAKYPDKCTVPKSIEEFCTAFSSFCSSLENKTDFLVVKEEFFDFEERISQEELLELGHDFNSTLIKSNFPGLGPIDDSEVSGPFIGRRPDNVLVICYSMLLRVDDDAMPLQFKRSIRGKKRMAEMRFNAEPDEVFVPERPAGFLFHVHTPFTLENPLENAIFIQPKQVYVVHVTLEEDHLLPHPFQSDCINYTDLWLKNNRSGPRSQESCLEKCEMEYCLKDCNCSFPEVFYPTTGQVCTSEYRFCHEIVSGVLLPIDKELNECNSKCKDDCQRFRYQYFYQFRIQETNPFKPVHDELNDAFLIDVAVIASSQEILRYHQRPQYSKLDVFSSLGGFIGAWLGVSLVAVVDLLESLLNIVLFFFRRRRVAKTRSTPDDFV